MTIVDGDNRSQATQHMGSSLDITHLTLGGELWLWMEERSRTNGSGWWVSFSWNFSYLLIAFMCTKGQEVGMKALVGDIKGCDCELSEVFGLKGLYFYEIGDNYGPPHFCSISPTGLQQ